MLNSALMMLVGAKRKAAPVVNQEPYRVVWNPQVMLGNEAEYIKESVFLQWSSDILATAVLTDYDPLDFVPYIRSLDSDVLLNPPVNVPALRTVAKGTVGPIMQIPRIREIANPDRRGKIPKVFQIRYRWRSLSSVPNSYMLMRYMMNTARDTYVGIQVRKVVSGYECRIEACPDGISIFHSTWASLGPDNGVSMSDDIRMVIFADRVGVYLGQPGTEITRLLLDGPWVADSAATLDIGILPAIDPDEPIFETDALIVYDGNF